MSTPPSGSARRQGRVGVAEFFTELAEATDHLGPAQVTLGSASGPSGTTSGRRCSGRSTPARPSSAFVSPGRSTIWLDRNFAVEGQQWFETLLERPEPVADEVRAKALGTAAMIAGVRAATSSARWAGDKTRGPVPSPRGRRGVAWSLTTVALGPMEQGRPEEAGPMLDEAEDLHRKLGLPGGLRRVLHQAGEAAAVGDLDRGRRLLRESADLSVGADDHFSAARARSTPSVTSTWRRAIRKPPRGLSRRPSHFLGLGCRSARLLLPCRARLEGRRAATRAGSASVGLRRGLRRAAPLHVAAAWPLRGAVRVRLPLSIPSGTTKAGGSASTRRWRLLA